MSLKNKALPKDFIVNIVPFYYGWIMLPIAMIAMVGTSPGQTFIISIFNTSFRESLNLSHSQLTGAYMFGTLAAAAPQAYIGSFMDRFGIRRTMSVVVFLFGLSCMFASQVTTITLLFLAFVGLRMFGQGALSLLASNTVAMWFDRQLGRISGVMNVGFAAAVAVLPPLVLFLINQTGWRLAYIILGLGVWALLFPILALLFRNTPEDIGQMKDGVTGAVEGPIFKENWDPIDFSLHEALKTPQFWFIAFSMAIWAMIGTAVIFNIVPLFEDSGLSAQQAALTFTIFSVSNTIFQLVGGWLADKVALNRLGGSSMLVFSLSIISLLFLENGVWLGWMYAFVFGIGQGISGAVNNTIWVRYYGRLHLGKIRGAVATATVAGSSLGPFIMGFTFDLFSSYQFSLSLFAIVFGIAAIAFFLATNPNNLEKISYRKLRL